MHCESCHAEISEGCTACPECRALVLKNIKGFENIDEIIKILKTIIEKHSDELANTRQLIALFKDYLPDYDKERRLLVNMLSVGILDEILSESDKKVALMRAKNIMLDDCYLSETGVQLVLVCFTNMLGLKYTPKASKTEEPAAAVVVAESSANDKEKESGEDKKTENAKIEDKVMSKMNAIKFRLTKNVVIDKGFTKMDGYCFEGFGVIRSVKLPDTLLAIGEYAFTDCKHLREIDIPASVKKIEKGAFNLCVGLEKISLPDGILDIGENTFLCCSSLVSVSIPDTVSSIGANAFSGCEKLKTLIVPQSVKFIDEDAFAYCPELTVCCYENSYVHKYCMKNDIKVKTSALGTALSADIADENAEDNTEEVQADDRA